MFSRHILPSHPPSSIESEAVSHNLASAIRRGIVDTIVCLMSHSLLVEMYRANHGIFWPVNLVSYGSFNFRRTLSGEGDASHLLLLETLRSFENVTVVESFLALGESNSINSTTSPEFMSFVETSGSFMKEIISRWCSMLHKKTSEEVYRYTGVDSDALKRYIADPNCVKTQALSYPEGSSERDSLLKLHRKIKVFVATQQSQVVCADFLVLLAFLDVLLSTEGVYKKFRVYAPFLCKQEVWRMHFNSDGFTSNAALTTCGDQVVLTSYPLVTTYTHLDLETVIPFILEVLRLEV